MRIIGGQFKGKKILEPKDKLTRPLKDLVKESIFNIINHSNKLKTNLNEANILDLFSGVGSFGLEALSREAKHVTFVEKEKVLHFNILKNINRLGHKNNIEIIHNDAFRWLKTNKRAFDYIFLDPPFDKVEYTDLLCKIYESKIINDGGKVFLETNKQAKLKLSDSRKILKNKIIGDVRLMILQ